MEEWPRNGQKFSDYWFCCKKREMQMQVTEEGRTDHYRKQERKMFLAQTARAI